MNEKHPSIKRRLRYMPKSYRAGYRLALAGDIEEAIFAQCNECVGWEPGEVAKCTDVGCPLHSLRLLKVSS